MTSEFDRVTARDYLRREMSPSFEVTVAREPLELYVREAEAEIARLRAQLEELRSWSFVPQVAEGGPLTWTDEQLAEARERVSQKIKAQSEGT